MRRRQPKSRCRKEPPPRLWLFTDERIADDILLATVRALPKGSGIVFRHYRTSRPARRALYERIRTIARGRGLILLLAGSSREASAWRADGVHMGSDRRRRGVPRGLRTAAAHNVAEVRTAERAGVDMVFLSPVFLTRSHPGAQALGGLRFGLIAASTCTPVVALGGMTPARFRRLRNLGAYGWAAIDGLAAAGSTQCDYGNGAANRTTSEPQKTGALFERRGNGAPGRNRTSTPCGTRF